MERKKKKKKGSSDDESSRSYRRVRRGDGAGSKSGPLNQGKVSGSRERECSRPMSAS